MFEKNYVTSVYEDYLVKQNTSITNLQPPLGMIILAFYQSKLSSDNLQIGLKMKSSLCLRAGNAICNHSLHCNNDQGMETMARVVLSVQNTQVRTHNLNFKYLPQFVFIAYFLCIYGLSLLFSCQSATLELLSSSWVVCAHSLVSKAKKV